MFFKEQFKKERNVNVEEKEDTFLRKESFEEAVHFLKEKISSLENKEIAILIDIDGILVDNFGLKFKKISFSYRKMLLDLVEFLEERSLKLNDNFKVFLVSDRIPLFSGYFPFFSGETQEIFRKHNIDVILLSKIFSKSFSNKNYQKLLNQINQNDLVFYLGSGLFDKILYKNLRNDLEDGKKDNLSLILVGDSKLL